MPAGLYRALLTVAGAIAAIVLAIVISSVAIIAAGGSPEGAFAAFFDFGETERAVVNGIVTMLNPALPLFIAGLGRARAGGGQRHGAHANPGRAAVNRGPGGGRRLPDDPLQHRRGGPVPDRGRLPRVRRLQVRGARLDPDPGDHRGGDGRGRLLR